MATFTGGGGKGIGDLDIAGALSGISKPELVGRMSQLMGDASITPEFKQFMETNLPNVVGAEDPIAAAQALIMSNTKMLMSNLPAIEANFPEIKAEMDKLAPSDKAVVEGMAKWSHMGGIGMVMGFISTALAAPPSPFNYAQNNWTMSDDRMYDPDDNSGLLRRGRCSCFALASPLPDPL